MGFFSNIFSKQPCQLCGKEVGTLSRVKLKDKQYICSDCRKNTSAFFNPVQYDLEGVKKHIEYMQKQDELYKKEFETLPKEKINRIVYLGYYGIVFADELAMFEIITPETKKRNYKELFRYDQIKDFKPYGKENTTTGEGAKKYSETGLRIVMSCANSIDSASYSDEAKKQMHPYASEFILPVERNTNNLNAGMAKNHLNGIFGRPDETLFGSIKEKFTGTEQDRNKYDAVGNALGAFSDMVKGKATGNEADMDSAREKMELAMGSAAAFITENRSKYAKVSDEVEIRAIGETFKDLLYK